MLTRKIWLGIACLSASSLPLSTAHADRRTSLSGNLLVEDPDDLFPFPQLTVKHRNMIRLDYGPGAGPNPAVGSSGNGVFTLGDERVAYGVALHRGDLLSPDVVGQSQELSWLGGIGDPFGATNSGFSTFSPTADGATVLPATVFDLFYGRTMGDNLIGMRLGLGHGIQATNVAGETAKGAQTFIAAQLGYSLLPAGGLRLDLSGNVVFALGKSTTFDGAGEPQDANDGTDIRLGLLGRVYYPINDVLDLGFLVNCAASNEHTRNDPADAGSNDWSESLMAGAGPSIHLERAQVAAYGGLQALYGSLEPNNDVEDNEEGRLLLVTPMVNMAVEAQVLDWLYVRSGAQYVWGLDRNTSEAPGTADNIAERTSRGVFGWTAGIGMQKDNFSFDGTVTNGFVTGGPNFIGGTSPGFLAMASATYRFGDVLSGAGSAPGQPAAGMQSPPALPRASSPAPVEAGLKNPPHQEVGITAGEAADTEAADTEAAGTEAADTEAPAGNDEEIGNSVEGSIGTP